MLQGYSQQTCVLYIRLYLERENPRMRSPTFSGVPGHNRSNVHRWIGPRLQGPRTQKLDFQNSDFFFVSHSWYECKRPPAAGLNSEKRSTARTTGRELWLVRLSVWWSVSGKRSQLLFGQIFALHWRNAWRAEGIPCMSKCAESCINNGTDRSPSKLLEAWTACVAKWPFYFRKLQTISCKKKQII